ncbi:MAG: hypothetical protein GYA43_08635 [Bacteroidales bacterium]|nr:hypothetical protein [Bacteroidales bacterium]
MNQACLNEEGRKTKKKVQLAEPKQFAGAGIPPAGITDNNPTQEPDLFYPCTIHGAGD